MQFTVEGASPCRSSSLLRLALRFVSSVRRPACRQIGRLLRPFRRRRRRRPGRIDRCRCPAGASPRRPWEAHRGGGGSPGERPVRAGVVPCQLRRCVMSGGTRAPCPRDRRLLRRSGGRGSPCDPWTPSPGLGCAPFPDPDCSSAKTDWLYRRGFRDPVDPGHAPRPARRWACSPWHPRWGAYTPSHGDA